MFLFLHHHMMQLINDHIELFFIFILVMICIFIILQIAMLIYVCGFMIQLLQEISPRLSLCFCIHHNVTNAFGRRHSLVSCQYIVNLGQNKVGLLKKRLKMMKIMSFTCFKPCQQLKFFWVATDFFQTMIKCFWGIIKYSQLLDQW